MSLSAMRGLHVSLHVERVSGAGNKGGTVRHEGRAWPGMWVRCCQFRPRGSLPSGVTPRQGLSRARRTATCPFEPFLSLPAGWTAPQAAIGSSRKVPQNVNPDGSDIGGRSQAARGSGQKAPGGRKGARNNEKSPRPRHPSKGRWKVTRRLTKKTGAALQPSSGNSYVLPGDPISPPGPP